MYHDQGGDTGVDKEIEQAIAEETNSLECSISIEEIKEVGELIGVSWNAMEMRKGNESPNREVLGEGEIGVDGKKGWINTIIRDERPDVIGLQETKSGLVDEEWVEDLWGSKGFGFTQLASNGKSGGLLLVWDANSFKCKEAIGDDRYITVKGEWKGKSGDIYLNLCCSLSVVALDRKLSDHCPIVLKDIDLDFGPKPFRVFDVWLEESDIDQVVLRAWGMNVKSSRPDCVFRDKLKNVEAELKKWSKDRFGSSKEKIEEYRKEAMKWELEAENRSLNEEEMSI
ncbi:transposon TX1 [Tanacetum coccineum]|uniref:Transposon TX1 n=1 Tax=Tanacetum coccineum TaxID=301880 RepID=A0ABQ4YEN1_9ASTR